MARIIKAATGDASGGRGWVSQRLERAEARAAEMVRAAGDEGFDSGRLEAAKRFVSVAELERSISRETDRRVQGAARQLVGVVLRQEIASAAGFLGLVRHSLRAMRRGREIFLRVHPSRAKYLQKHRDSLVAVLGRARTIEIREDISLPEDGCVVETDAGVLDVGFETQLSALFEGAES